MKSKTKRKKRIIAVVIGFLTIFSQASCKPSRSSNRIIVASAGKVKSLDPAQANTLKTLQLISALGDTLYRLKPNGDLEPRLAKSLPEISNNGLTITIPLRENVLFHDGTKFDSKAMEFSIKRFMKIGTLNYVINGRISKIETPSPFVLRLILNRPSSSIKGLLTSINLTPLSPSAYKNYQDKFLNKRFIGTGPYQLNNFQTDKQRLIPFKYYWGKKTENPGIDYIHFTNSTTLFGSIRTKEVDVLLSTSMEDIQILALNKLAKKGKLVEGEGPAMEIGYITFRSNTSPLNNKKVRESLSYSLNRSLISKNVSFGLREPLLAIIPPSLKKNDNPRWPKYNPQKAKKLLLKEGYCNNKKLTIDLTFRSNVPADKLLAITWQQQINRDISDCISLNLKGVESTTVYKQLGEGAYEAVMLDWTGAYPDPEAYLAPLLSCKKIINDICEEGEAVLSGSFWASSKLQNALIQSEKLFDDNRLEKLNEVELYAANGGAYLPVWLVKPRAWAQTNFAKPEFDGSGLMLLDRLKRLNQ